MAAHDSHLDWPFFDEAHRGFARRLEGWAAASLEHRHEADVDATCRALVRELQPETPVILSIVNWWQAGDPAVFVEPGDHAGELETAALLHVAPHLVHADRTTWGTGAARASRFEGVRRGWAWLPRRWTQVTDDTGVGDPRAATAEAGAQFVAQAVERIAAFCEAMATADPAALYARD